MKRTHVVEYKDRFPRMVAFPEPGKYSVKIKENGDSCVVFEDKQIVMNDRSYEMNDAKDRELDWHSQPPSEPEVPEVPEVPEEIKDLLFHKDGYPLNDQQFQMYFNTMVFEAYRRGQESSKE
jgi:hypothetical protein